MDRPSQHPLNPASLSARCSLALLLSAATLTASAHAATLCVDQHGAAGCSSTIGAAIAASSAGDTIQVRPGTYHESVVITSSLSLVGQDRNTTIIDANGLDRGVFISGFDNPAAPAGVDEVTVSGFTIRNASFEGILVTNGSHVTIAGNTVRNNDQSLHTGGACPGLPAFETAEADSCGSGIHLIGTVHSSVSGNLVQGNAGGILVSDETTTSHDDLIARNLVENNPHSHGITLASFPAYLAPDQPQQSAITYAFGTYDVLVTHNECAGNGSGANGAGIAILAPGPANRNYANSIASNHLIGNAGPGILLHVGVSTIKGAKDPDASRNDMEGNVILGNGADPAQPEKLTTGISILGEAGVIDTMIANNVIDSEAVDVAFNSASTLDLHLNDLLGRQVGVLNLNSLGQVQASLNWWGCSTGPGTRGCSTVSGPAIAYTPWLKQANDLTGGHLLDPLCLLLHLLDTGFGNGLFSFL